MSTSVASILDRFLAPWAETLTTASAEQVLRFQLDLETKDRIEELRVKANEGTLTAAEAREYEQYIDAIDLLGILRAKAREALSRRANP